MFGNLLEAIKVGQCLGQRDFLIGKKQALLTAGIVARVLANQ